MTFDPLIPLFIDAAKVSSCPSLIPGGLAAAGSPVGDSQAGSEHLSRGRFARSVGSQRRPIGHWFRFQPPGPSLVRVRGFDVRSSLPGARRVSGHPQRFQPGRSFTA
jgi:hypothetical protein